MSLLALSLSLAAFSLQDTGPPSGFDALFTGRTLRFDYYHAGDAGEEHIGLDRYRLEGVWAGSRTQLIDGTDLGRYLFSLHHAEDDRLLYTRGFASIYGEWETTAEASRMWRVFHESQRFPEPRSAVRLALHKRSPDGSFREIYSAALDPESRHVDRSPITPVGILGAFQESGPVASRVDLLIVGEGYTRSEAGDFDQDVSRLMESFFAVEPFRSRRPQFNVRTLHVPSAESGISNPREGVWRDAPLGLSFNAFDSDRYVLTEANRVLREATAQAPHDAIILLFNDVKYGGGGIFNLWSTCAAGSDQAPYLIVHEFGHSFAGLADEYYTSQVSYEDFNAEGVEPWEPNITAMGDPAQLKWRDLVSTDTPLPTPWEQAAYDEASYNYQERRQALRAEGATEEAMEELFREVKEVTGPLLEGQEHSAVVGAFVGAGYRARGLYRSEVDCIMFTRNRASFCRVCSRGIERVIDLLVE